jgi:SNF2 family DNA or RNA helicase
LAYRYKTAPFPHQRKAFTETAHRESFALLWEQGVGKTKPLIDTASFLYLDQRTNTLFVVAPNGVHRNWVSDEIPTHMPDLVLKQVYTVIWKATSYNTQKFQRKLKQAIEHPGLTVVVVAYESTITENFKTFARKLFKHRKIFMVLDESHRVKNSDSQVKYTLVAMGGHAKYRRIASGTPLERPLDLYAQYRFLAPEFWPSKGFHTFEDFKNHFAVFGQRGYGSDRVFTQPVDYKNLDELSSYLHELGWRLTKEEAGLDLPPKIYSRRYCDMTAEQWRVYNELQKECKVTLQSGDILKAETVMTRMLRLQQIACNFVSCEAEQPTQRIDPKRNLRMDLACDEILDGLPHQAIIFHRFRADIDDMCERLGDRCVRYDGKVDDDGRARAKLAFQRGDVQFFVASKAASTGLTLVGAKTVLYYSNLFELITRLQSEDRAHRIGQTSSVNYIDIIAEKTIDEYVVNALRRKFDIVNRITRDEMREWL